jgi:hypothetical protein
MSRKAEQVAQVGWKLGNILMVNSRLNISVSKKV